MIDEILDAVMRECRAFFKGAGGTVMRKSTFMNDEQKTYSMPLILVDLIDGSESGQLLGGITRMDWLFGLNSYNYQPDAYADDNSGYSVSLLKVIDDVRVHFSSLTWLTQEMNDIETNYGFRFTLTGVTGAEPLELDGLKTGYKIVFDSVALDVSTDSKPLSSYPLESVVQINYPPA